LSESDSGERLQQIEPAVDERDRSALRYALSKATEDERLLGLVVRNDHDVARLEPDVLAKVAFKINDREKSTGSFFPLRAT